MDVKGSNESETLSALVLYLRDLRQQDKLNTLKFKRERAYD